MPLTIAGWIRSLLPSSRSASARTARRRPGRAAARYDAMVAELLAAHGVRVRRWRRSMSGAAWEVRSRDGTVARYIESPLPRGPMSAAVFLHEIGHHAIGLNACSPRCLEEYHAWSYSLSQMRARGVPISDRVRARVDRSLRYAVSKAVRRGLKRLPAELSPFAPLAPGR